MFRILIPVFLLLLVYRIVRVRGLQNSRKRFSDLIDESGARLFIDPVCGKEVVRKNAYLLWQDGQTHGFCSKECLRKFGHETQWKM